MTAGSSAMANLPLPSASQIVQQTMQTSMAGLQNGYQNVMNIGNALGNPGLPPNTFATPLDGPGCPAGYAPAAISCSECYACCNHSSYPPSTGDCGCVSDACRPSRCRCSGCATTQQSTQPQHPQTQATAPQPHQHHHHHHHHHHNHNNNNANANVNANANPNPAVNANANANAQALAAQQSVSRVFKLQFDARRIICCSQDPRIVGWDFAAGDPEIIEASRFFAGP